ncbi:MAG: thiamine phosphate synthase [Bacillota bacterium]
MFTKPAIYFIMGIKDAGNRDPLEILEEALIGGISCFQLREKGPSALRGEPLKQFAESCQELCRRYQVPFIINDDVNLAISVGADGVHVGQDDADCASVRARIGRHKLLGVSAHTAEEAKRAISDGADYIGMGPVYGTRSKEDANQPLGVNGMAEIIQLIPDFPVVGIGGITPETARPVWRAGAAGVAVISSLAQAGDVAQQVERFRQSYEGEAKS